MYAYRLWCDVVSAFQKMHHVFFSARFADVHDGLVLGADFQFSLGVCACRTENKNIHEFVH